MLSDLKQGCEVPQAAPVTVCPDGQYGCRLGDDKSWTLSPGYVPFDAGMVRSWTNDYGCQGDSRTSPQSNAAWLAESIADDNTGAAPTFNYPNTSMSGWLCRSLRNLSSSYFLPRTRTTIRNCPNNSSTQGHGSSTRTLLATFRRRHLTFTRSMAAKARKVCRKEPSTRWRSTGSLRWEKWRLKTI